MIRRLVIENFMTHKHTVLELHRNVNVLTGPNNTGKSAVVEALRCLTENPPSPQLIRHGASKAVVRLELDDGSWVQWERTASSALYKARFADGREETYAKFGRGNVPEEIRAILRIRSLRTNEGSVDIHIGNQRTPIFLLDQSGSQAAGFFAASTEAEYLLAMQQALRDRTADAQRERLRLENDISQRKRELAGFASLAAAAQIMEKAENLSDQIKAAHREIPALKALIDQEQSLLRRLETFSKKSRELQNLRNPPPLIDLTPLEEITHTLEKIDSLIHRTQGFSACLTPLRRPPQLEDAAILDALVSALEGTGRTIDRDSRRSQVYGRMKEPPQLMDTEILTNVIERLDDALRRLQVEGKRNQAAHNLRTPPELQGVQGLESTCRALSAIQSSFENTGARHEQLISLTPPPELHPTAELLQTLQALKDLHEIIKEGESKRRRLERLEPPPGLRDLEPLLQLVGAMTQSQEQYSRLRDEQRHLEDELELRRHAVQEIMKKLPICPFCRQPMDPDHFLEAGHV